jgi:hypothetical protein
MCDHWWTLSYLQELAQRIALPDAAGWCATSAEDAHPFASGLELAIGIEQLLLDSSDFILSRYARERLYDGTMEEIWINLLISLCHRKPLILEAAINAINALDDVSAQIRLLCFAESGRRSESVR